MGPSNIYAAMIFVITMVQLFWHGESVETFNWRRTVDSETVRESAVVNRERESILFISEDFALQKTSTAASSVFYDLSVTKGLVAILPRGVSNTCFLFDADPLSFDELDTEIESALNETVVVRNDVEKYIKIEERMSIFEILREYNRSPGLASLCSLRRLQRVMPLSSSDTSGFTKVKTVGLGVIYELYV